jgi:signal transduction histidine kinase
MADSDIVERFARHRMLSVAPRNELAWLAAHGCLRTVECGEKITENRDYFDQMIVVLSGHIAISIDRGLGPRSVMEWGSGDITGALPYSRMSGPPPGGVGVADKSGEVFMVPRAHFAEMIRECPTLTTMLVHHMLDRARQFTVSERQDEKMASLGRLSAGLAHELNNPAAAAERSAQLLPDAMEALGDAAHAFGAARLGDEQHAAVERWRKACATAVLPMRTTLERADREDAITSWLETHGAETALAPVLVDTPLTTPDLDALAATLPDRAALIAALRWLAADCGARALAGEIERATVRIHTLVTAIKNFSYMDRVQVPEAVVLTDSFADSMALLRHKVRQKSAHLALEIPPDVPRVRAIGSDLNQIWMNLIDNALDAIADGGHVTVSAERRLDYVLVRIVDDGEGIAPEISERIFDPFFTTKPVGKGTGLGLDITQRLVRRNGGDIGVDSRPGRTEFHVTLPAAPDATT